MTHYVLGIHNCPAPPQTTCSGGRPIAPTAMWERATGRFESPAATDNKGFIRPHSYCVRLELGFMSHRGLQRVASSRLISSSKSETQDQLRGSLLSRCAWFFFTWLAGQWAKSNLVYVLKKTGQKVNICLWNCSDPAQNPYVPQTFWVPASSAVGFSRTVESFYS